MMLRPIFVNPRPSGLNIGLQNRHIAGVTNCSELDVQGTAPFAMDRHTAIEYKDDIWVFGGDRGWTLTNKLWKFHSSM